MYDINKQARSKQAKADRENNDQWFDTRIILELLDSLEEFFAVFKLTWDVEVYPYK